MRLDRTAELQQLAKADRHIGKAEQAIAHQMMEIERLRERGHDMALAMDILRNFEFSLRQLEEHRKLVIRTIEGINAGLL